MAIETHIEQLEEKHKKLESELGQMLTHPSSDDVEIADMKRQKLHLKDRRQQLRAEGSLH